VARGRFKFLATLLLFVAGLVNFLFGFRSLGGVCLLAGFYLAAQGLRRARQSGAGRISPARLLAGSCVGAALAVLVVVAYGHAARDGLLGAPAAQKYSQESSGKFGVLVGGRPETFASLSAIVDSPIVGHGSWAKDPKYTNELLSLLSRNGYQADAGLVYGIQHSGYLIPSHSYFFGAWVEAGVFGAVFWLLVLAFVVNSLLALYTRRTPLSPLIAFLGCLLLWNVFFSPYGADQRILTMFSVAVLLISRYALPADVEEPAERARDRNEVLVPKPHSHWAT
jgi:hypothetical protein